MGKWYGVQVMCVWCMLGEHRGGSQSIRDKHSMLPSLGLLKIKCGQELESERGWGEEGGEREEGEREERGERDGMRREAWAGRPWYPGPLAR